MASGDNNNNNTYYTDYYHLNSRGYSLYVRRTSRSVALSILGAHLKKDISPNYPVSTIRKYLGSYRPSSNAQLRREIIDTIDIYTFSDIIRQKLTWFGISEREEVLNTVATFDSLKDTLLTDDLFFDEVFKIGFQLIDRWIGPTSHA